MYVLSNSRPDDISYNNKNNKNKYKNPRLNQNHVIKRSTECKRQTFSDVYLTSFADMKKVSILSWIPFCKQ